MRNITEEQKAICLKYNSNYQEAHADLIIGVSQNVKEGILPINGLRHPAEGNTAGWYIWAGDEFSEDPEFFIPLHIKHLEEWCPLAIKYLGLPPGWRFLVTPDYEDVWFDNSLLNI